MIVRVGGIEIDKSLDVNNTTQLMDGFAEVGIDEVPKFINWMESLSISERTEFTKLVNQDVLEVIQSFVTFGLF